MCPLELWPFGATGQRNVNFGKWGPLFMCLDKVQSGTETNPVLIATSFPFRRETAKKTKLKYCWENCTKNSCYVLLGYNPFSYNYVYEYYEYNVVFYLNRISSNTNTICQVDYTECSSIQMAFLNIHNFWRLKKKLFSVLIPLTSLFDETQKLRNLLRHSKIIKNFFSIRFSCWTFYNQLMLPDASRFFGTILRGRRNGRITFSFNKLLIWWLTSFRWIFGHR